MTPQEVNRLLAWAASYDSRLTPRSQDDLVLKATAWAAALDDRMTFEWAQGAITNFYTFSTTSLMVGDLNEMWRQERRRIREREIAASGRAAIEKARADAVPMPDEIRRAMRELATRSVIE